MTGFFQRLLSPEDIPVNGFAGEEERTCRFEPAEPLRLLAGGDAYAFKIFPTYEWRGRAAGREDLEDRVQPFMGRARRTVVHVLRPIARSFHPHKARDLEAAVNKRTDDEWRRFSEAGRDYWYTFSIRAEPDDAVQEQLRPYWEARIKAECEHELSLQRARQADRLTREWSTVFDSLEQDPRAADAAKLSGEEFAAVFGSFVGNRRQAVRDLLSLLRDAVNGHSEAKLGPSEYTEAWDRALRAFQKQYGLEVTESEGEGRTPQG